MKRILTIIAACALSGIAFGAEKRGKLAAEAPAQAPAAIDDEEAIEALLTRLEKAMPKDWAVAAVERGKVKLWYWNPPEGNGIRVHLLPKQAMEEKGGEKGKPGGLIAWLMEATYTARQPKPSEEDQTLPPQELAKWRGRRVMVWGAVEAEWPRWKSDLLAVLAATDSPSSATETLEGVVIEKRANVKSYEAWNSPGDPYYVLDIGDVTENRRSGEKTGQQTGKRHITLRPSATVSAADLAGLKGNRVALRGHHTEGEPYKPSGHAEQVPMEPVLKTKPDGTPEVAGWGPANRGAGFVVEAIAARDIVSTSWSEPTRQGLQTRFLLMAARPVAGSPIPLKVELRHEDGKDWAQNAIVFRYEGAVIVTDSHGKEVARHVEQLNFNTWVPGGGPLELCRIDLRDTPYGLGKPGNYVVQFAGFQAGDLANKGMVDLPPTATLEFEIAADGASGKISRSQAITIACQAMGVPEPKEFLNVFLPTENDPVWRITYAHPLGPNWHAVVDAATGAVREKGRKPSR